MSRRTAQLGSQLTLLEHHGKCIYSIQTLLGFIDCGLTDQQRSHQRLANVMIMWNKLVLICQKSHRPLSKITQLPWRQLTLKIRKLYCSLILQKLSPMDLCDTYSYRLRFYIQNEKLLNVLYKLTYLFKLLLNKNTEVQMLSLTNQNVD